MFLKLGDRLLGGDETYTATFSKNILKYGYPKAYDGKNILYSDFDGESCTKYFPIFKKESYALIFSPWLEMYVTAASFFFFGLNTFAARFPFALCGLISLVVLYFFTLKLTKNKKIANLSIFLLAFYIPFYLYSRTARYHSLTMLLSLLVLYFYLGLLENKKLAYCFFVIFSVLLFYAHYIPFFAVYPSIILHFLIFKFNKKIFKNLIYSSFIIFCFTFPWFLYANFSNQSAGFGLLRILEGFVYLSGYFSIYTIPFVFYLFFPGILYNKNKFSDSYFLLFFLILFGILITVFGHSSLPSFRYIAFLFPISMILMAAVLLDIKKHKYLMVIIIILLIFTNYLFIFPFKPFEKIILNRVSKNSDGYLFIKDGLGARYFMVNYLYEITHHHSIPEEKIINEIKTKYNKGDIILTNGINEVYIFYLDATIYRTSLNKSPNWIIPKKPDALWDGQEDYEFVMSMIDERYEKIVINSTDYIYPLDSPHPRTHRFKENKEMKTKDIYPYETYPIEIYHLMR